MKKYLVISALMGMTSMNGFADSTRTLFNQGWSFVETDVKDVKNLNAPDISWKAVDLPHDWDIYHAPSPDGATGNEGGYYPGGTGWYKKTFVTPAGKDARKVRIHFEGVYQRCEVYVNGQFAGRHAYGYTPFSLDVTRFLAPKGKNVIAVKVNNSQQPNCRWYSGSGMYRSVWLETTEDVYIEENSVFVTTKNVSSRGADVSASVTVRNESEQQRTVSVSVFGESKDVTLAAGASKTVTIDKHVANPRLWSPESPELYKAEVTLAEGGRTLGHETVSYGIRTFTYDAERGFVLNGKPLLINGACVHHDDGVLGAMAFDRAEIRKVRLMKDAGFNLIRTSHNPSTRAFLDACDSIGMLVIDEAFDGWRSSKTPFDYSTLIDSCYREDISAMVLRDRNHPSVISWSIGNEVIERRELRVVQTARQLKAAILAHDKTRPVTEALCSWFGDWEIFDPHAEVLDIVGYNYMIHKHASDHERDPRRVMWQTESYPRDAFRNWKRTSDYPYIIGDIVWTGLDYLGESGIGQFFYPDKGEAAVEHYQAKHFPYHGAYCGDVDMTGWRKPISHYRSILWTGTTKIDGKQHVMYMGVREPDGYYGKIHCTSWAVWPTWESWNWKGHEGKNIDVDVFTRAPRVQLYLNGKLVATHDVSLATEYKTTFTLPYEAGELKTVALDASGKELESSIIRTASAPYSFRMTPERKVLTADGQDLGYIILELIDKDGNVVPDADVTADVRVSGAGSLMAAASASFKDIEPTTSSRVTTYKGRAVIIVRSQQKAGNIKVSVNSKLATPVTAVTLKTKK